MANFKLELFVWIRTVKKQVKDIVLFKELRGLVELILTISVRVEDYSVDVDV